MGVRDIFQGFGSGGSSLWVRDVGGDPPCGLGPGEFSRTGWPIISHKYIHDSFGMEVGNNPPWRMW